MNYTVIATLLVVASLLLFPLIGFSPFYLIVVILVCYYCILASGWNLLTGYTGLISFSQAAFSSLAAYSSAMLAHYLEIPIVFSILLGILLAGTISFLLGTASLKMIGAYLALATIGFSETVSIIIFVNYQVTGGATGFAAKPLISSASTIQYYYVFIVITLISLFVMYKIITSKIGLMMRAVRDDQDAAISLGVDVRKIKLFSFTTAGIFAGLAGTIYGHYMQILYPAMGSLSEMALILAIPIIGGLGSFLGPIIGSIFVVLTREYIRANFGPYDVLLFGIAVIFIMRFARNGIMGIIKRVYMELKQL